MKFDVTSKVFAQTTFDPLTISVGARALGMGKAYVAVAEGAESIFSNPAGLGEIDAFCASSMAGTVLEDAKYTMLCGVYPLGAKSAVGIGYTSAGISSIDLYDANGTYLSRSDFSNSALVLSYGRKFAPTLSFGINLKGYTQDGSGNNNGDGNGWNLDVGFLQKDLGWLSWGVVGQNLISSSKIVYNNANQEELPGLIKFGARMCLLGNKVGAAFLSPWNVTAALDADLSPRDSQFSSAHSGIEAELSPNVTVRTGSDQGQLVGGVSFFYSGLGIHYAYHPYGGQPENLTHYLSISFNERGWEPEGRFPAIANLSTL